MSAERESDIVAGTEPVDQPVVGTSRFRVHGRQGSLIVDLTVRRSQADADAGADAPTELSRRDAERLLTSLQTRLLEADRLPKPDESSPDDRASEQVKPTGVPYQEMGLTREEFDALADDLAHMAPYWDREDMDEYYELLKR